MDWNKNIILNKAVKKVDQNIKLIDFPHITENGEWVTIASLTAAEVLGVE